MRVIGFIQGFPVYEERAVKHDPHSGQFMSGAHESKPKADPKKTEPREAGKGAAKPSRWAEASKNTYASLGGAKHFADWKKKLTPAEAHAADSYTRAGYIALNEGLSSHDGKPFTFESFKPGQVYQDHAFMSTSAGGHFSETAWNPNAQGHFKMVIGVPQGTPGAFLKSSHTRYHKEQQEFLLNRGTKLKIVKVTSDTSLGYHRNAVVHAIVID